MKQDYTMNKSLVGSLSFSPPRTIVLIGLMGAGKTSIGKRLAKRLNLPFHDSDHEVEVAAGCPIKEILDVYGEEEFFRGEYRVINRLLDQPTHVLATGGGSFMTQKTRDKVSEKAISVWLKADLETLLARVSRRTDRPFLEDGNHREILEALIDERYPYFEEADVVVDTFDEPTAATVERVIVSLTEFIRVNYPHQYILKSVEG
jgi:shikimate kinase